MSGVRRKTKYRKAVEDDVLHSLPEPKAGEEIVRVVAPRGGNLIEVETADGAKSLCRLPNRYRKVVWVKRGTLLIVGSCTETYVTSAGEEGKVKYEVNQVIFTDDQIKHLRKVGLLPVAFDVKSDVDLSISMENMLHVNSNRRQQPALSASESDSDSDDSDTGKLAKVAGHATIADVQSDAIDGESSQDEEGSDSE